MSKKARVNEDESNAQIFKIGKITEAMLLIEGKPVKSSSGAVIKFHFNSLGTHHIQVLADINGKHFCEMNILRSGTGLTVLVFL
jgi:hypothetical protein